MNLFSQSRPQSNPAALQSVSTSIQSSRFTTGQDLGLCPTEARPGCKYFGWPASV